MCSQRSMMVPPSARRPIASKWSLIKWTTPSSDDQLLPANPPRAAPAPLMLNLRKHRQPPTPPPGRALDPDHLGRFLGAPRRDAPRCCSLPLLAGECGGSSDVDDHCPDLDLIPSDPVLPHPRTPSPGPMGQKTSSLWPKPKISLTWALNSDLPIVSNNPHVDPDHRHSRKTSRGQPDFKQKTPAKAPEDKNEPPRHEGTRSVSPSSSTSTARMARRRRLRRPRVRSPRAKATFGYEIQDVDEFLSKASLDSPGNIPMVLSRPCVLYETHTGGPQREVSLPLGMVVNGVLKNRAWLYAQTPHGEEGYVPYACCLPLGILPAPSRPQPCWDTQTDIFPRPSGNRTDREKLKDETRSECGSRPTTNRRRTGRDSGERSVDSLYLKASRKPATRQTLLVIGSDYRGADSSKLTVCKGDVVSLVSCQLKDWFWVRDRSGKEGFIPAVVAGHGFL